MASGSRCRAIMAPAAMAGAESRGSGSSTMVASWPSSSAWRRAKNRKSPTVMTIGGANNFGSASRSSACWNVERSPTIGMNCLGMPSRDTGQSRVPEPPARSTGTIRVSGMIPSGTPPILMPATPRERLAWPVRRCPSSSGHTRPRWVWRLRAWESAWESWKITSQVNRLNPRQNTPSRCDNHDDILYGNRFACRSSRRPHCSRSPCRPAISAGCRGSAGRFDRRAFDPAIRPRAGRERLRRIPFERHHFLHGLHLAQASQRPIDHAVEPLLEREFLHQPKPRGQRGRSQVSDAALAPHAFGEREDRILFCRPARRPFLDEPAVQALELPRIFAGQNGGFGPGAVLECARAGLGWIEFQHHEAFSLSSTVKCLPWPDPRFHDIFPPFGGLAWIVGSSRSLPAMTAEGGRLM